MKKAFLFVGDGCRYCPAMEKALDRLGVKYQTFNRDNGGAPAAKEHGIRGIPTLIVFKKDGTEARVHWRQSLDRLRADLEKHGVKI